MQPNLDIGDNMEILSRLREHLAERAVRPMVAAQASEVVSARRHFCHGSIWSASSLAFSRAASRDHFSGLTTFFILLLFHADSSVCRVKRPGAEVIGLLRVVERFCLPRSVFRYGPCRSGPF